MDNEHVDWRSRLVLGVGVQAIFVNCLTIRIFEIDYIIVTLCHLSYSFRSFPTYKASQTCASFRSILIKAHTFTNLGIAQNRWRSLNRHPFLQILHILTDTSRLRATKVQGYAVVQNPSLTQQDLWLRGSPSFNPLDNVSRTGAPTSSTTFRTVS